MEAPTADDAASLLDQLCTKPGFGGPVDPRGPVVSADMFRNPDGSVIVCKACGAPKNSDDPLAPETHLTWNKHGRPADVRRHSTLDFYCETVWHKQFPKTALQNFLQHVST